MCAGRSVQPPPACHGAQRCRSYRLGGGYRHHDEFSDVTAQGWRETQRMRSDDLQDFLLDEQAVDRLDEIGVHAALHRFFDNGAVRFTAHGYNRNRSVQ